MERLRLVKNREDLLSRIGLSKQRIFDVAKEIAAKNQLPTARKIRAILATGSITTIQKYLQEWKKQCFKQVYGENNIVSSNLETNLIEKYKVLKLELQKQLSHNETYAQELMRAETTLIKLTETNQQLNITVSKLQNDLDTVTKEKVILEDCYQKLTKEIVSNRDATILQQEQTIESLRQEIQTINQTSFNAIQQVSFAGHDALLQEKVKTLNLAEKVKELQQLVVQQQNKLAILSKALQQQQPLEFAKYERIGHG